MRYLIIKLLGGYTKEEVTVAKVEAAFEIIKSVFRREDQVYINHKDYDPSKKYYLLESYNGGNAWYVSQNLQDNKREPLDNGALVEWLSHDPIPRCITCNQILNKTKL